MAADSDFFLKKTITRQLAALDCKTFIITATKPKFAKDGTPIMKTVKGKDGNPLFNSNGDPVMIQIMIAMNLCRENKESTQIPWTLEDLLQDTNLSKIKSLNVRDFAIYITPQEQGTDKIHILVDDTSDALFDVFGEPNNFLQTSPNSQQAIYTLPYTHQRELYIEVFNYMNLMYGDRNLSGLRHPFRLTGFSNRKLKYMDANGNFPFVKSIFTRKAFSQKLTNFIDECAAGIFPIADEIQRLRGLYKLEKDQHYSEDEDDIATDPTSALDIPRPIPRPRPGMSTDHRGEDFFKALKAVWQGMEVEALESHIAENSDHILDPCGYDMNFEAYIEKIAANAAAAVAEAKANFTPRPVQKDTGHRHNGAKNFLAKKQQSIL